MPQKMIAALGAGVGSRDLAQGRGVDAADRGHLLRAVVADVLAQLVEILGMGLDVLPVVQPLLDDRVNQRVEHRDVAAGRELQHFRSRSAPSTGCAGP